MAQLVEALRYEVAGSIPDGVIRFFVGSTSNRNDYQEYFLGLKAAAAAV